MNTEKGKIKYPNYRTYGEPVFKGLRNKRSQYWQKIREIEARKKRAQIDQEKQQSFSRDRY